MLTLVWEDNVENEGCASLGEVAMVGPAPQDKPIAKSGWIAFAGQVSGVYLYRFDAEAILRLLLQLEHLHRCKAPIDEVTYAEVKTALSKFNIRGVQQLRPFAECLATEPAVPVLRVANAESVEHALTQAARANERLDALVRRLGQEFDMYDWSEAL